MFKSIDGYLKELKDIKHAKKFPINMYTHSRTDNMVMQIFLNISFGNQKLCIELIENCKKDYIN